MKTPIPVWSFAQVQALLSLLCFEVIVICRPRNSLFSLCILHRRKEGHSDRTVTHYQRPCHTQGISNLGHRTMRSCLNLLVLSVSSGSQSVSGTLIKRSGKLSHSLLLPSAWRPQNISHHGNVVSGSAALIWDLELMVQYIKSSRLFFLI